MTPARFTAPPSTRERPQYPPGKRYRRTSPARAAVSPAKSRLHPKIPPRPALEAAAKDAVEGIPASPGADGARGPRARSPTARARIEPASRPARPRVHRHDPGPEAQFPRPAPGAAGQPVVESETGDAEAGSRQAEGDRAPRRKVHRSPDDLLRVGLDSFRRAPMRSRLPRALAERNSPQTLGRGKRSFSRSTTRRPNAARTAAAAEPAGPPPTTAASKGSGAAHEVAVRRSRKGKTRRARLPGATRRATRSASSGV